MRWTNILAMLALLTALGSRREASAQESVRTIEVHVKRFAFSPSENTLKKGETVDLKLISDDVTHSLAVKELNISRETSKGHPADIVVTPRATGDFRGKCGRFCGSGHGTMVFTIHVQD